MEEQMIMEAVRLEALGILNRLFTDCTGALPPDFSENLYIADRSTSMRQVLIFKHPEDVKEENFIVMFKFSNRWCLCGDIPMEERTTVIFKMPAGAEHMPESHAIKTLGLRFALAIYELCEFYRDDACHPSWWFGKFSSTLEID